MDRRESAALAGKYAWSVKVGEKGQIVIPKQAREVFEIQPGDTLLLLADKRRGIAIPPKGAAAKMIERLLGGEIASEDAES